jgi:ABC-type branched-subunit amino acid transport system substrate-binding protein
VTADTIRVGAIADLSGIFSGLVVQIVDAQTVYWDMVNAGGGIGGRQVEFVVLDNAYDVPTHLERYEAMRDTGAEGVVMLSQSTGSPHTAAIAEMAVEDNLAVIPLSWYSGWSDPEFGKNIFESYSNYCYESMNGVEFLNRYMQEEKGIANPTLAIVTFPGEYGGDGAAGARLAAEALGVKVVADLGGTVIPGADNTPTIAQLVEADADMVWTTLSPGTLTEAMLGASAQGYEPMWSGNVPSFSYLLLGGDLGPLLDTNYIINTYIVTWNTPGVPGLETLKTEMTAAMPDALVSDAYVIGWTEAMAAHQALEQAAANGDLTRAGVVRAFNEITVDYDGLAPNQSWGGDPNASIVRETYTYDAVLADYDVGATLAEGGGTGSVLLEGPRAADITKAHVFDGACFKAS